MVIGGFSGKLETQISEESIGEKKKQRKTKKTL